MVFLLRIILCFPCSSLSGPETINTSLNLLCTKAVCQNNALIHVIFVRPGEVTISLRLMTFWWCSFLRILISRMAVIGNWRRIQKRWEPRTSTYFRTRAMEEWRGNTYALSLVVHADLLERHDFLRLLLLRHEHLPGNNHKKNASARARPGWAGAQAP